MNEQVKHTPGPWHLNDDGCLVIGERGPFRLVKEFMSSGGMPTQEEALANANLIAAAPELLEALKFALIQIEDAMEDEEAKEHTQYGYYENLLIAQEMAQNAITKAQGGV